MTTLLVASVLLIGCGGLYTICRRYHRTAWNSGWLECLDVINRFFCKYFHRLHYQPVGLPPHGSAILAANHMSGLDPFLLLAATHRPLRFLIAREEYERTGLTWLFRAVGCIPVDRAGKPEIALRAALRALEDGEVIAVFPHGKFHLPHEQPHPLKRGVLWLSQKTGCAVYPAHLAGVSGVGLIFMALLVRSRARIYSYPPLKMTDNQSLETLRGLIDGEAVAAQQKT